MKEYHIVCAEEVDEILSSEKRTICYPLP